MDNDEWIREPTAGRVNTELARQNMVYPKHQGTAHVLMVTALLITLSSCIGRNAPTAGTSTCKEWAEDLTDKQQFDFARELLIELRNGDLQPGQTDTPTDASVGFFKTAITETCQSNVDSIKKVGL